MSEEIKDIMDALENNELKDDGFWGRACSRLSQQLQAAKEENKELELRNDKLCLEVAELAIELQTAKKENEKLMEQLNTKYLEWEETFMENQNLTQQNKQMREYIEKAEDIARTYQDY